MDFGRGGVSVRNDDERVDLEIGELAVDVDSVQARDEVDQDIVDALWDLLEQSRGQLGIGGELLEVDWDQNLLGFGVNITDVDTTFVCE